MKKLIVIVFLIFLTSGCAQYTRIKNVDLESTISRDTYSQLSHPKKSDDIQIFLSLSGGGTRAAAFSYGVLEALRDASISYNDKNTNLLSQVDVISSVSGGSFTAAYYGLYGDKIFNDYEQVFLNRDIQKVLISSLFNPFNWIRFLSSGFNRTELAVNYYDKFIFKGATFADFREDMPFIQINATDLSSGQPFIFKQEYFNFICSDISQFKVARAVTASSAVPVVFAPIPLKNHKKCGDFKPDSELVQNTDDENFRRQIMRESLRRYLDKDAVQYLHLVDGGIADNLGLRVLYDTINYLGGPIPLARRIKLSPPRYLVIILVNAAVSPEKEMDISPDEPEAADQITAISSAQISRYSLESIELLKNSLTQWATEWSEQAGQPIKPYFIQVDFSGIQDKKTQQFFNTISTSLSLPAEQVKGLREAAKRLLNNSPEYQQLLHDINHPN